MIFVTFFVFLLMTKYTKIDILDFSYRQNIIASLAIGVFWPLTWTVLILVISIGAMANLLKIKV